jgi:hypothetical protein
VNPIAELIEVIAHLHGCKAKHIRSMSICEIFREKVIWDGTVEIFAIKGHPEATVCYAWKHWQDDEGKHTRIVTVLEIPPVDSPVAAVRAAIGNRMSSTGNSALF